MAVMGHLRSTEVALIDRSYTPPYQSVTVTIALSFTSTWPHLIRYVGLEEGSVSVLHYYGAQWHEQFLQVGRLDWIGL